jgi:hypothetical protein
MLVATATAEADYEAWDAETAVLHSPELLAQIDSDADYETWDAESGMFGTIAVPDFASESAIATRDDSADYLSDDE